MMRSVAFLPWAVCVILLTLPAWAQEGRAPAGNVDSAAAPGPGTEAAASEADGSDTLEDDTAATDAPASQSAVDEDDEDKEPLVVVRKDVRVRRQRKPEFDVKKSILSEPFEFDMAKRRDPFGYFAERADPMDDGGLKSIKPPEPDEPETTPIEDQKLLVTSAADLLARMKKNIHAGKYKEAIQIYDQELKALLERRKELIDDDLRARLDEIQGEAAKVEDLINQAKLDILHEDLSVLTKRVEQSWQAARYDEVVTVAKEFEKIFTEGSSVTLGAGAPEKKQAISRMRTNVNLKQHRSEVRLEFAKKSFEITGIAWSPTRSFAIINEQDIGQGESIDDVRIVTIRPGRITMEYRGESFDKFVD